MCFISNYYVMTFNFHFCSKKYLIFFIDFYLYRMYYHTPSPETRAPPREAKKRRPYGRLCYGRIEIQVITKP